MLFFIIFVIKIRRMNRFRILCVLFIGCLASSACLAQTLRTMLTSELAEGDLLFCASSQGNRITEVTEGFGGMQIDHVAIVHRKAGRVYALEAIHRGVCLTPIDSLLLRRDAVIGARLRDTTGVAQSVQRALTFLGRPYDFNFMPDDSAFYCSELVQKCYRYLNGQLVFLPIPMSFHDKTGMITPYWKDYYARQGLRVPEGEPGSNPGDLSRSKAVMILGKLQRPKD